MMRRVTYPARLLNEGERVVVSTRTHPKALIGPGCWLLAILVAVTLLGRGVDDRLAGTARSAVAVALAVAAVALAAVLVLRPFLVWLTTTYTFTDRRFIKRAGLIAKEGRTIPLNRISGVDFEIGVVDRIFGCGTLIVSDASTDGRVLLADIPHVERVQLQVAEQLHRLAGPNRADDGT